MAVQKEARVAHLVDLSGTTRILELEPAEPLDFVGGQYLIVNSGIVLPDGKLAKRAYTILSSDARQERVVMAVRRLDGPGSAWMCTRTVGDQLPFSGPWGKFLADDATPRRTLVLATDTGITAALGLIAGRAFEPQRAHATLVWLVEDGYFLSDAFVGAALCSGVTYRRHPLPRVGHPERLGEAQRIAGSLGGFDRVFLAGDGAVVHPLREQLFPAARVECYFNNPGKKSA
ncbi:MAG: oxidoreductase FAD-binding protein [Myxococcales bacterium]|nr:oxidoreductase FAD-binding protein [Myxococcales bacterium]